MNGDKLSSLPVNSQYQLSKDEEMLATNLFGPAKQKVLFQNLKMPAVVAILVALFLHPISDSLVTKIYPSAGENMYLMMIIKAVLAGVIFFVLTNISKVKK